MLINIAIVKATKLRIKEYTLAIGIEIICCTRILFGLLILSMLISTMSLTTFPDAHTQKVAIEASNGSKIEGSSQVIIAPTQTVIAAKSSLHMAGSTM